MTIILNYHGEEDLKRCIWSLCDQEVASDICIVDNEEDQASRLAIAEIRAKVPSVKVISNSQNLGFAGGVNCGIRLAMAEEYPYFALLNNDATVDRAWLGNLLGVLEAQPNVGIATGLTATMAGDDVDSAGIMVTRWGIDYSRGRGLAPTDPTLQRQIEIFGASAGASLYRTALAKDIGLFDEDFFAYYEDLDVSWRARLAGWDIKYVPSAVAYHRIGGTSAKMPGFTVYQMFKNMPMVFVKNVPTGLLRIMLPRFALMYFLMLASQIRRNNFRPAIRGVLAFCRLAPSKLRERRLIQRDGRYDLDQISGLLRTRLPETNSLSVIYRIFRFDSRPDGGRLGSQ